MIVQAFLFAALVFGVEINAFPQEMIIDETDAAEMPCKGFPLRLIRIYSVFEGFMNFHVYDYIRNLLNCQEQRRHSSPQ